MSRTVSVTVSVTPLQQRCISTRGYVQMFAVRFAYGQNSGTNESQRKFTQQIYDIADFIADGGHVDGRKDTT